jgi:hypothetical protein
MIVVDFFLVFVCVQVIIVLNAVFMWLTLYAVRKCPVSQVSVPHSTHISIVQYRVVQYIMYSNVVYMSGQCSFYTSSYILIL